MFTSVSLGNLETDRAYPIVHAERTNMRYGQNVLVTITDSPNSSAKFFLPRLYGDVVSEEDLDAVNSQRLALILIYKGTCPRSNSYILELKRQ
jgi:hypothetical protein